MAGDQTKSPPVKLSADDKRFIESQVNRVITIRMLGEIAVLQGNRAKAKVFLEDLHKEIENIMNFVTDGDRHIDAEFKAYSLELVNDIFESITIPDNPP